jgi:2-oxoglutarate ferredoxin oxidoreductase subunit gamma
MKQQEIIIAGFGGQGILSAGRLIAYAGMLEDKHVSWLPSYGPEMRGGTANCHVIVSEEPIGSPILNSATAIIVMNSPSLEKFESIVEKAGLVITDSSLVDMRPSRTDVDICEIPASEMASDMGNATYAGIILLGKLIAKTGVVSKESFEAALKKVLPPKYHHLIPEEMKALDMGMGY